MGGRGGSSGLQSGNPKQNRTLDSVAKKIKNLKREQMFVVDEDGNILLHKTSKETGEVKFTAGEGREYFKGNVVMHNHPGVDGIAGTFSSEDLRTFGYGAKAIQVSSVDGRYTMVNKNYGTKKQYDGWYDMQKHLEREKEKFPTGLKARDLAKKQPHISSMSSRLTSISDRWVKAKEAGNTSTMDSLMKQYDSLSKQYKKALATETRRQTVKPYHDFYKKNASKYGFSYKHDKNK